MNIIFDLDGTLIDSSERLYQLFQYLVPMSQLSKNEYWNLKRNKIDHKMILEKYFKDIKFEDFNDRWMDLIETEEYLKLDKNYPNTIEILENLSQKCTLILLTARQSKKELDNELKRLGIIGFFSPIIVTEGTKSKKKLLLDAVNNGLITKNPNDLFVSDMGKDILFGKECSYITIGISHGFMSKEKLIEYKPKYIIDDLNEIKMAIDNEERKNG